LLDEWLGELRRHYDIETEFNSEQPNQPPPQQPLASPYQTLYLLPDAPPEVVKASYKALAKLYHPDLRSGYGDRMVEINRDFDAINSGRR
jgi:DnaJ-class molecular chaperone